MLLEVALKLVEEARASSGRSAAGFAAESSPSLEWPAGLVGRKHAFVCRKRLAGNGHTTKETNKTVCSEFAGRGSVPGARRLEVAVRVLCMLGPCLDTREAW